MTCYSLGNIFKVILDSVQPSYSCFSVCILPKTDYVDYINKTLYSSMECGCIYFCRKILLKVLARAELPVYLVTQNLFVHI